MKIFKNIAIALTLISSTALSHAQEDSESTSIDKKWVQGIQFSNGIIASLFTAYSKINPQAIDDGCGCKFDINGNILNPSECDPVFKSGSEKNAKIALVPLMDPNKWAGSLMCFRVGSPQCVDANGIAYIGETCCSKIDKSYSTIKRDLHMSIAVPQPIAEELALRTFQKVSGMRPISPSCPAILIDDQTSSWFLNDKDGFIARMWLYAYKHYGADLPYVIGAIKQISETNPPQEWEFQRSDGISKVMGYRNQDITDEFKSKQ